MSARRPRFSPSKKYRKVVKPIQAGVPTLVPISEAPRDRLPPDTAHLGIPRRQAIFSLPAKKKFIQFRRPPTQGSSTQPQYPVEDDPFIADNETTAPNDFANTIYHYSVDNSTPSNAHKRQRQWRQWQLHTIPSLIAPYLDLLKKTRSLRDSLPSYEPPECSCASRRSLTVLCIFFHRMSHFGLITVENPN